jgi:DNA-binding transcriptional regulator GbsR (MarR family)
VNQELEGIRQRFVEAAGQTTQTLGVGRALGQTFAHIYFSREPQSLQSLTDVLGISKGSASMVVRQLEQWGALRRVWVKGDRKDYYEATDVFGDIIRKAVLDRAGREIEMAGSLLDDADHAIGRAGGRGNGDVQFFRERVKRLQDFRGRVQKFWSSWILSMLLRRGLWKEKKR